jgi:hypothetical protein
MCPDVAVCSHGHYKSPILPGVESRHLGRTWAQIAERFQPRRDEVCQVNPGDFPLGSIESRAAARVVAESLEPSTFH